MAQAETFHLIGGQTVSGEIVSIDDKGIVLKQADGTYADRIPWTKFSQADLKELEQNPKAAQFVEPFIEVTQADKLAKTEIEIKDFPRLTRPTGHSFIGAMFTSAIGIFIIVHLVCGQFVCGIRNCRFQGAAGGFGVRCVGCGSVDGTDSLFIHVEKLIKKEGGGMARRAPEETVDAGLATAIAAEQVGGSPPKSAPAAAGCSRPAPDKDLICGGNTLSTGAFLKPRCRAFSPWSAPKRTQDMVLTVKSTRGTSFAQPDQPHFGK